MHEVVLDLYKSLNCAIASFDIMIRELKSSRRPADTTYIRIDNAADRCTHTYAAA